MHASSSSISSSGGASGGGGGGSSNSSVCSSLLSFKTPLAGSVAVSAGIYSPLVHASSSSISSSGGASGGGGGGSSISSVGSGPPFPAQSAKPQNRVSSRAG